MLRINSSLLSNAGLNAFSNLSDYQTISTAFFQGLLTANGVLPSTPFVELHPYSTHFRCKITGNTSLVPSPR